MHDPIFTVEAFDSALRQFLAEPSHAQRFLNGVADVLESNPFSTMTRDALDEALNLSAEYILGPLDSHIRAEAAEAGMAQLPVFIPGEPAGLYTARVRACADGA